MLHQRGNMPNDIRQLPERVTRARYQSEFHTDVSAAVELEILGKGEYSYFEFCKSE